MGEFVNTVDIIGEESLVNAIIDRTLSGTFADDTIKHLRDYAFNYMPNVEILKLPNVITTGKYIVGKGSTSLKEIYFPALAEVKGGMCSQAAALEIADFGPNVKTIRMQAFWSATKLKALILRRTDDVVSMETLALDKSGIATNIGYVYVPSALVDSYKSATNWSTYAARFRALESYTVDGTTTGDIDNTKI